MKHSRIILVAIIFIILSLGLASFRPAVTGSHKTVISAPPSPTTPNVGIWNDACFSSNITIANPQCAIGGASLAVGSTMTVDINLTNAPAFNGYEFSLFYDPAYLALSGINHSVGTMFNQPFNQTDTSAQGVIRDSTVNLASSATDNGTRFGSGVLVFFTFTIKGTGVSPLVLSSGTSQPSSSATQTDWTRLAYVNNKFIDVSTSDGYFQNEVQSLGPIATFSFSPATPQFGQAVTFDARGSFDPDNKTGPGIISYEWDFGDGISIQSNSPTQTHIFAPSAGTPFIGNFSVLLKIVDFDDHFIGMISSLVSITPTISRDVALNSLVLSRRSVSPGINISITVLVQNLGTVDDTYNLTLSYGPPTTILASFVNQLISHQFGHNMRSYNVTIATAGLSPGAYQVSAMLGEPVDSNTGNNSATASFTVIGSDLPPIASFFVFPPSPTVGHSVSFDGSLSFDPDGSIVSYQWTFGDAGTEFGPFVFHTYQMAGNYTVTLAVTDNVGLQTSISHIVRVLQPAPHDIALVFVEPSTNVAVATQIIDVSVGVFNSGTSPSTFDIVVYYGTKPAAVLTGVTIPVQSFIDFHSVSWDTSGVPPGNYTISAVVTLAGDPTPADNTLVDGQVTILPPPALTISPTSGSSGAKVTVQGTGFAIPSQGFPGPFEQTILVTFDDMFIGFAFTSTGSFNFTFDVPLAQSGLHAVKALDEFSLIHASAPFQVLPSTSTLVISVQSATVYFPGDTSVIYVLAISNGSSAPSGVSLQVTLIKPDGSTVALTPVLTASGLFKATYSIPSSASTGTYALLAVMNLGGSSASALGSFEVKPSWLSPRGQQTIIGTTAILGLAGVAGIIWKKNYLKKQNQES